MLLHTTCMFLLMNIMGATAAREQSCPACSRYDYEERVLERVLRNELVIETMLKEIHETNVKVESALKLMHEDRHKLETTRNGLEKSKEEMDTEIKGTLHVSLKNMSDSLAFMKQLQEAMGTKLDNAIKNAITNMSDAVAEITQNASKTVLELNNDNEIMKGSLWTTVDNSIKTAMTNISSAVSEMTQKATMAGLQLKKENEILKDQLTIPSIYFYAYTPAAYSLAAGQDVVYTSVRVNEGQGYNPKTGIFTVSVPGLYLFTVHYCIGPSTQTYIGIAHQGTQLQQSVSQSVATNYATFSIQAVIRAAMSDRIWVESTPYETKLYGSGSTPTCNSFSGALIHM